jgi:hypothetical protein
MDAQRYRCLKTYGYLQLSKFHAKFRIATARGDTNLQIVRILETTNFQIKISVNCGRGQRKCEILSGFISSILLERTIYHCLEQRYITITQKD